MAITTSWNRVVGLNGRIRFNANIGTEEAPDYYPMQIQLFIDVTSDDNEGKKKEVITKNVGTNQPTAFDMSTVAGLKDLYQALPSFIQAAFKDAIVEAIDEDTSV